MQLTHKLLTTVIVCVVIWSPLSLAANSLLNHPSPYLALHGNDPVNWLDWNKATVAKARQQNKLLYLSVGYFSCHWCHVMQRQSYQNPKIAEFLNEHFIPVKIDRELMPALDARLIKFAERSIGRAGWPLNVFITPSGYPIYAVLYMPAEQFNSVLKRVQQLWQEQPDKILSLARLAVSKKYPNASPTLDSDKISRLEQMFLAQALAYGDDLQGGFGKTSKFPNAPALEYLLGLQARAPSENLAKLLTATLDAMREHGMYDHLDGGFFRYAVDPDWETPHFEKMLYTNAQLARIYLRADKIFPRRGYGKVAHSTLQFMLKRMRAGEGALVAAFSAIDAAGVEGGYYLWTASELGALLTAQEVRVFKAACGINGVALAKAGHLPKCNTALATLAIALDMPLDALKKYYSSATAKLLAARQRRELPTDDKLLAGWNGLALAAFSDAARQTGRKDYAKAAADIRHYLMTRLYRDGALLRAATDDGKELGHASLEDYAYVTTGLWEYARLTGNSNDYNAALRLAKRAWSAFRVDNGWRLVEHSMLAPKPTEQLILDGAMPSPAALLARLNHKMAKHFGDQALLDQAINALNRSYGELNNNAFFFATHISALGELLGR